MKKLLLFPVLLVMVLVTGCQKEESISGPANSSAVTSVSKPAWLTAAEKQGLKLINFKTQSSETVSLEKMVSKTVWGTVKGGAYLGLSYRSAGKYGMTTADVSLNILPNALQKDMSITMSFDGEYMMSDVDLTFGPHGTQFLRPALLNVIATGLDLSAYPKGMTNLYLWYYNETTGVWEKMNSDFAYIDANNGILICCNGYLPHFSRYGFTTAPVSDTGN